MNLVYTIINLIVLFLLLRHFLIKPVSDIMEKRRQMIADGLQGAQDAQSDAQKMKQEYEDALKGAKLESAAIVEKARSEAKTEYDRIVSEAGSKAGDLLEAAKENVRIEREKTMKDLQTQIAGLAMASAEKIVGDKEIGQIALLFHVDEQVDDPRLNRNVQRRNRFVADNEFRLQRQRTGNADDLPHTAVQLVRIVVEQIARDAHAVAQRKHIFVKILSRKIVGGMNLKRLTQNGAHGLARVQRGIGILKDDLHFAAVFALLFLGKGENIRAAE